VQLDPATAELAWPSDGLSWSVNMHGITRTLGPAIAVTICASAFLIGPARAAVEPTPTAWTLRWDRRTICASTLQHWSDLDVTRNDTVPAGTKITAFGTPLNGKARLIPTDGFNQLQYRDANANGDYWRYYEVKFPNGTTAHAFWRVTADRTC
jgi:hypothetical protein